MNQNTLNYLERSLEHFRNIYRSMKSEEIARRTTLPFEREPSGTGGYFRLRIMGVEYRAAFPEFAMTGSDGKKEPESWKSVLFLRYLCEGKYIPSMGKQLSYREIPWGNVYYRNFEGRCLLRFAYTFGSNIEGLMHAIETSPGLKAEKLNKGDASDGTVTHAAYRFEFMSGLYMQVYVWAGDDEFPPSAQMLFDDNFPSAFTAEDIAVVGDAVIDFFKK
jgi:hypothetical protein